MMRPSQSAPSDRTIGKRVWFDALPGFIPNRLSGQPSVDRVRIPLLESINMKTLRFIAICAAALSFGQAWAQDKPVPTSPPSTTQDVGGSVPGTAAQSGSNMKMAQPMYQDSMHQQQYGDQRSWMNNIYHGR
jgi:hypothetical protein